MFSSTVRYPGMLHFSVVCASVSNTPVWFLPELWNDQRSGRSGVGSALSHACIGTFLEHC